MVADNLKKYGPTILRFGIAITLLWFGFSQIKNPNMWVGLIPKFVQVLGSPVMIIYLNGTFEVLLATLLCLGLFTRIASALLVLHLFSIVTFSLGYGAVAVRDFGLMISSLAIFFNGADDFSIDYIISEKKRKGNKRGG